MNPAHVIRDLLEKWDTYRERWIARHGTADGFDEWFRRVVLDEA